MHDLKNICFLVYKLISQLIFEIVHRSINGLKLNVSVEAGENKINNKGHEYLLFPCYTQCKTVPKYTEKIQF